MVNKLSILCLLIVFNVQTAIGGPQCPLRMPLEKDKVQLIQMKSLDLPIAQRMARFFIYDMAEFMGEKKGWHFLENGSFECESLGEYFENIGKDNFPYFVRYKGYLAGFVLISKNRSFSTADYHMGEFFISRSFKGRGLGRYVAEKAFNMHPGSWDVHQFPDNCASIKFWERVVSKYTNNKFTRTVKLIKYSEKSTRPAVVIRFDNSKYAKSKK